MNRSSLSSALLLLAVSLSGALTVGCGGDGICDAGELSDALGAASLNDTVTIGECELRGSFTVPAGVTLAGAGTSSRLVASGGPAVILTGGREGAVLRDVAISSAESTAVFAEGGGAVAIYRVRVDASKGIAIRLESVAAASLTDVTLTGPVTAEIAATLPPTPDAAVTATHGLVLVDDAFVVLERVTISGFARFGALAIDSTVTWTGGGASDTLGVGFMAEGGSATLRDTTFCRVFSGLRPTPAYGLVFTAGASADTQGVTLCENEGYGMLQNGGRAAHVDLVGSANREPAVWVQQSDDFALSGAGSMLDDNALAGIVVVQSTNVSIADAQISGSSLATRIPDVGGVVQVGDGVHLVVDDPAAVTLTNVMLLNNVRAGLLLDFRTGTPDAMDLSSVTVEGTGTALGAIAQDGAGLIPSGTWDRNITRSGATIANDAAFAGRLGVVGAVGPMFLPPASM